MEKSSKDILHEYGDPSESTEQRREIFNEAVIFFRRILSGIDDYAIMASAALYLQNQAGGLKPSELPNDFDLAFFSEAALKRFVEALAKTGRVVFFGQDGNPVSQDRSIHLSSDRKAKRVAGKLLIFFSEAPGKTRPKSFPFEAFLNTRVAPTAEVKNLTRPVSGFRVLSRREGLPIQYGHNLELEKRVKKSLLEVITFLLKYREYLKDNKAELQAALKKFDLSQKDLERFYFLIDEINQTSNPDVRRGFYDEINSLLSGGFKVRISERIAKLEQMKKINSFEIRSAGSAPSLPSKTPASVSPPARRREPPRSQIGL